MDPPPQEPERERAVPAQDDTIHEQTTEVSTGQEPTPPTYLILAHGESYSHLVSTRNKTQFSVLGSVYAVPQAPHDFGIFNLEPPQSQALHYEFTFLSRHALHVRFSLATSTEKQEPFPDDPEFPPLHVRDWLCRGYYRTPEDKDEVIEKLDKEILSCGVELNKSDFYTWVNPQLRGGMEYEFVTDKQGLMGFTGFYNYAEGRTGDNALLSDEEKDKERLGRVPLWKQNIHGPFTSANMPSGIGFLAEERRCFELFELQTGENLNVAFTERNNPAKDRLQALEERDGGSADAAKKAGSDAVDDPDLLFCWTDRNWGVLVKKPLPVSIESLQRIRGKQLMLSISTKGDRMEYIIVAGEALEKMKALYGNSK